MSRIGKIARLPKVVRDELNERLLDGEPGNLLVEWLNGREDVRAALAGPAFAKPTAGGQRTEDGEQRTENGGLKAEDGERRGRNPWITEQNLSEWRKGGFEDWRRQQETEERAARLLEETSAVADAIARRETGGGRQGTCLTDRVATMAALALGELLMAARRMEDGEEKRRTILKIVRALVRLRKSERDCERAQREAAQNQRAQEIHEHWAENARRRSQPVEPAPKRVWWTEEDQALEGSDDEAVDPPSPSLRRAGGEAVDPPSPGLRRAGSETVAEHEHEQEREHDYGDVRARMAEVIEGMSDEEIAESLRQNGYLRSRWTRLRQAYGGQAVGGEAVDPPVRGTIPHPGAPDAKTGQSVASLGTPGLRRAGGETVGADGGGNPGRSDDATSPARGDPSESK